MKCKPQTQLIFYIPNPLLLKSQISQWKLQTMLTLSRILSMAESFFLPSVLLIFKIQSSSKFFHKFWKIIEFKETLVKKLIFIYFRNTNIQTLMICDRSNLTMGNILIRNCKIISNAMFFLSQTEILNHNFMIFWNIRIETVLWAHPTGTSGDYSFFYLTESEASVHFSNLTFFNISFCI